MRKIYFLLFVTIVGLSFSSCKKEAKEAPKTLDISGNWKLTALSTDFIYGADIVATAANQPISNYVDHIAFQSDGTGTMSVNDVVIRKFNYEAADAKIHFSNVFNYNGKDWVSTGSFMSFITVSTGTNLEFTDQVFIFTKETYQAKQYDQYKRHITLVKEN